MMTVPTAISHSYFSNILHNHYSRHRDMATTQALTRLNEQFIIPPTSPLASLSCMHTYIHIHIHMDVYMYILSYRDLHT